ncbi:EamA family transporter [Peribacillus sp. CSMR9]|uniref:EamA family transporter n=1 Tax=Peribacillus sp. CSMR9 TaxID=2981350 RepID=UPI002953A9DA|nr:EamA family transporter [Peribacillus sp. CSMR9]MDV7765890.1 DMT family transporter [Peribacillus sp. CSMR9]
MKKSIVILFFLILANLFWAGNYIFDKYVVTELSSIQLTFTRWLIAVFLLFPLAQWIEKPYWRSVWKEWRLLLKEKISALHALGLIISLLTPSGYFPAHLSHSRFHISRIDSRRSICH